MVNIGRICYQTGEVIRDIGEGSWRYLIKPTAKGVGYGAYYTGIGIGKVMDPRTMHGQLIWGIGAGTAAAYFLTSGLEEALVENHNPGWNWITETAVLGLDAAIAKRVISHHTRR